MEPGLATARDHPSTTAPPPGVAQPSASVPSQASVPATQNPPLASVCDPSLTPKPHLASRSWTRLGEQTLAFILGACALLVAQSAWKVFRPPEPLAVAPSTIDVNAADVGTLRQLPGIGPHLAARIVAHREENGPFTKIEDLQAVRGIGPVILARLRTSISVNADGVAQPGQTGRSGNMASRVKAKASPPQPIDLNTATLDQLVTLPGIGPALAERIIEERESKGPFQSVQEITRVRGIKGKMLEKLRPYVTVGSNQPV